MKLFTDIMYTREMPFKDLTKLKTPLILNDNALLNGIISSLFDFVFINLDKIIP